MKEKDLFEEYIRKNRDEFNSEKPSQVVWENISKNLKPKSDYSWLWKAAAVLFFGLSSYLVFEKMVEPGDKLATIEYSEFSNTEAYYNNIIQVRREELEDNIDKSSPFYCVFNSDISELDSIYGQLKSEYNIINEDIVMESMIKNLQLRIEIMDRQLQIIQKFKNLTKNKDQDEVVI